VQSNSGSLIVEIECLGPWKGYPWLFIAAAVLLLFFWLKIMPWGKLVASGESVADDWSAFALLTPLVLVPLSFALYRGVCLMWERQSVAIDRESFTLTKRVFGWSRTISVPKDRAGECAIRRIWPTQSIKSVTIELNRKTYSLGYLVSAEQADELVEAISACLPHDA
jgi:hypothetical protein